MRATAVKVGVLGVIAAAALLIAAASWAAVKPGKYMGTTSERGPVAFTVAAGGTSIANFSASDGYNDKCKFGGGVGGIPNFSFSIPAMKVGPGGTFSGTANAKLGPFKATIVVKGKLTATGAKGTVNQVGALCGKGAANPSTQDYLETFSAKPAASS